MAKTSIASIADEAEQEIVLKTITALGDFGNDKTLKDDAEVWITKKEAFLLWNFIYGLLHRIYCSDEDLPEEQQNPVDH